jgi:hypothetical protein
MKIIFFILLFSAPALAQCDSALDRKLFDQNMICDSVTIAQSNEITRLQGEIKTHEATERIFEESLKLERNTHDLTDQGLLLRIEEEKYEKTFFERLFVGTAVLFTILFIVIAR